MLQKYEVLNEMHEGYLVAVIRGKNKEDAVEISKQTLEGGIQSIEVTFSTSGAEIKALIQSFWAHQYPSGSF